MLVSKRNTYCQQVELIKYFHRGIETNFEQISDSVFVSLHETMNSDYKIFLNNLKETGDLVNYNKCLPDSLCWLSKTPYSFSNDYFEGYNSNPIYNYYPVVNITYEAMQMYCDFLTKKYELEGKKYKKIIVRLPSEAEWEQFANPNKLKNLPWDFPTGYQSCRKKKYGDSCLVANIKVKYGNFGEDLIGITNLGVIACASLRNERGFFISDIIGNVSEMTIEEKAKGGSWDNFITECYINKTQDFIAPDPRLGFRIIIQIIE